MKKRLLSLLLLTALLAGIFSVLAFATDDPFEVEDGRVDHTDVPDDEITVDRNEVSADSLTTSQEAIDFIIKMEGFVNKPILDVSQYSIGYGCSTVYAEKYGFSTTSITKEEAYELLLCVITEYEAKLDAFLEKYNLKMTQHEYDALISFTFNVGVSWLNPNNRLPALLIDGDYTVNEFASAMGVWCHVGKEIDQNLLNRRIREIKMFLYGAYEPIDTHLFCVLIYDGNGGSPQTDIGFYLEGEPYQVLFSASHETEEALLGWYTEDGERITTNTIVTDDLTVYARWGSADEVEEDVYVPPVEEVPKIDLTTVFSDIPADAWYYEEVQDLYANSIINGYPDGTFRPKKTVTTGEALKMIMLACGYEEPEPVASHWARGYLNKALEDGLLVRGEITDLDVPISRELVCNVTAKALGLSRLSEEMPFTDTTSTYVLSLYDYGIIEGYGDNTFLPQKSLNRAELSAIVWRINDSF